MFESSEGVSVGILGGGQLGRMLALAARPLGLDVLVVDPAERPPAAAAARHLRANYHDDAVVDALRECAVITYEFENVPETAARRLVEAGSVVYPPVTALAVAQDRLNEKTCFRDLGIDTAAFRPVNSADEAVAAAEALGAPLLFKTRREGYDGKGQRLVRDRSAAAQVFEELGSVPLIAERIVDFRRELSLLAVRGADGSLAFYPLVENRHERGILRVTVAPADVTPEQQALAEQYGTLVLEHTHYVGVMALELFDMGHALLANELAPRVHNSGHFSIEGSETSQFENHLRAVLGWPLGATACRGHSAMLNFIGGAPPLSDLLRVKGAHVHLYDKRGREGRKIGHVTITAENAVERERALAAVEGLVHSSARG